MQNLHVIAGRFGPDGPEVLLRESRRAEVCVLLLSFDRPVAAPDLVIPGNAANFFMAQLIR